MKSILERTEMLSRKPVQRPQLLTNVPSAVTRPPPLPPPPPPTLNKKATQRKKAKLLPTESPMIPCEGIKKELTSDSSSDGETLQDMDVSVPKDLFCSSPVPLSTTTDDIK